MKHESFFCKTDKLKQKKINLSDREAVMKALKGLYGLYEMDPQDQKEDDSAKEDG